MPLRLSDNLDHNQEKLLFFWAKRGGTGARAPGQTAEPSTRKAKGHQML